MTAPVQKHKTLLNAERLSAQDSERRTYTLIDASFSIGGLQDRLFELLSAIEDLGSLVAAAKRTGLSYKGAWGMIERASLISSRPLIERTPGGGRDRGTHLTDTGRGILEIHRRLERSKNELLEELNRELSKDPILMQWYRRVLIKMSARNQWRAEVVSIQPGLLRHQVILRLSAGAMILANVSNKAASQMNLATGSEVIACVKTPMVYLIDDQENLQFSLENHFDGVITEVIQDELSAEVVVELPSGDRVVVSLSPEMLIERHLIVGEAASVFFDADAVILASLP